MACFSPLRPSVDPMRIFSTQALLQQTQQLKKERGLVLALTAKCGELQVFLFFFFLTSAKACSCLQLSATHTTQQDEADTLREQLAAMEAVNQELAAQMVHQVLSNVSGPFRSRSGLETHSVALTFACSQGYYSPLSCCSAIVPPSHTLHPHVSSALITHVTGAAGLRRVLARSLPLS